MSEIRFGHQSIDKIENQKDHPGFCVVKKINGSSLEIDRDKKIAKVKWVGMVNVETASTLLTIGGDTVEFQGFDRLYIDRLELQEFETEARVWIKNLLKTRAKRLSRKVNKMAIINANSTMGGIFSNMISTAIALVMPWLKLKKFDSREEGLSWLTCD